MSPEIIHETFYLKLGKQKKAQANHFLYTFEDNGFFVTYNKSLELSSYGKTEEEAKARFANIVFSDFCENLTELPEDKIFEEFNNLGWKRSPFFKKELSNTAHVDTAGVLRNFNLAEGAKIKEEYVIV